MPRWIALIGCLSLMPTTARSNDGAAEIALGGIRLKQERRVAMVKERLFISKKKVRVEYEFINESIEDVTTEIAFPIPDYRLDLGNGWTPVDDFKVWVNGKQIPHQQEARAYVKGREITSELRNMGLDIATFAGFEEPRDSRLPFRSQIHALARTQKQKLVSLGAIDPKVEALAEWTVKKNYHWTQTFPAKSVVSIAHEYKPKAGDAAILTLQSLKLPRKGWINESADPGCPDEGFSRAFLAAAERHFKQSRAYALPDALPGVWVRYILTTANTWKTPIKDFELIVERDPGELVSFCWDGPIEKVGANTFRARVKDFIPSKELTVYFLQP